ncbi:MAG: hypothetical protein WCF97_01005 [Nitrososphaeraceae archaeon]
MKNSSQCLTLLDDLEYFALDSISDDILYRSIKVSLEAVGKTYAKAVIDHICHINRLSEREILTNCELFEDSMYRLFGRGAQSVINKVKVVALRYALTEQKSNLTVPEILDPSLTINDVLKEIRSIEALDFVHKMSSYNHIAYLYSSKVSLSKILSEYFSPRDAPKALLSENPMDYVLFDLSSSISYKELFGPINAPIKEDVITKMRNWIDGIRANNKSDTSTRIAEDDATWWIRNGYTHGLTMLEQSLCKELPEKTSILCAFDISKLKPKQLGAMKSVIGSHDYVIIEEPSHAVYKFGKPIFRYE